MDPYSPEGELINLHTAFHAGAHQQVLDTDTSSLSSSNALPARVLKLRSQIALGQAPAVISSLSGEKTPELVAVKLLAEHETGKDVVEQAKKLAEQHGQENLTVQLCAGMVLARAGEPEEALKVLSKHQGSLDAVALIVQIHLQQNRTDLATKEAQRARKWAQDSLLVNIAESWVGMREGGEKYQSAFYVFEELAQTAQSQSTHSLVAQAVSELHLGRLPEAEAALQQAIDIDADSADTLANMVVLNTLLGKKEDEVAGLKQRLEKVDAGHSALRDWKEKKDEFERAKARYAPKFEAAT
ncbi:coatomer epsilon subunit-domain-containing protein [Massariosphaeria phaeospora]|uniref:Coatomer subunit epsilon n=1 Tax=Massariosphaeria phaeospora TaxID=100035 RepID=A0A7C8I0R8_9PLEO|nr:coatomer epsilon subunit-domain-containing protein [Massariosphaeria phaeospora]